MGFEPMNPFGLKVLETLCFIHSHTLPLLRGCYSPISKSGSSGLLLTGGCFLPAASNPLFPDVFTLPCPALCEKFAAAIILCRVWPQLHRNFSVAESTNLSTDVLHAMQWNEIILRDILLPLTICVLVILCGGISFCPCLWWLPMIHILDIPLFHRLFHHIHWMIHCNCYIWSVQI